MSDTLLPFPPNVRRDDPTTSYEASALKRTSLRARVLDTLERHPNGLTDHELTLAIGEPERRKPSVAKRRQEVGAVDTGQRRTSVDGCACIVWSIR